jgi:Zn-dependent membrane protease YugP
MTICPQSTFELRDRAVPHVALGHTVAVLIIIKGVLLDRLR